MANKTSNAMCHTGVDAMASLGVARYSKTDASMRYPQFRYSSASETVMIVPAVSNTIVSTLSAILIFPFFFVKIEMQSKIETNSTMYPTIEASWAKPEMNV